MPTLENIDEFSITEVDKQNLLCVLGVQLKPEEENNKYWASFATIKTSIEMLRILAEEFGVSTTGTKKQLMERVLFLLASSNGFSGED